MPLLRPFTLLAYFLLLLVGIGAAAFGMVNYLTLTRGIETDFPRLEKIIGTNVALEQYSSNDELQRAFDVLKRARITHVRQYFPWREIEATRGQYDWGKWDRIVNAARANGLQLVAVLYTAPPWSQRENERDVPGAPPNDFQEYARFVGDFAKRYGDAIAYYQIWDEPNVAPSWGRRNTDPVEYAQLLIPASQAIRASQPNAKIALAGLGMNLELHRPHPYYSEILYLRGLYEIGADQYFDIVAAKPYGMWSGPEDRRVNSGVLNFSRLILLRDEMRQYGDRRKPIWAVEMGWNALPTNWEGEASPWGTDTEAIQGDRLERALTRVQNEWAWVTGEFPLYLQPNAATNNPRWGFALLDANGAPRAFYDVLTRFLASPPAPLPQPAAPIAPLALLIGVALVAGWRAWHWTFALHLDERWRAFKVRVNRFPEIAQWTVLAATALAFYASPNTLLNFVLLGVLVFLFALRLDVGLALAIVVIPFWNYPKTLVGGFQLSPVECLTWVASAAFLLDTILRERRHRATSMTEESGMRRGIASRLEMIVKSLSTLDWAVLAFLILGFISTRWAANFGVASREFRIVVLDPILLYALVRLGNLSLLQIRRLVSALLASGIAVCAIGLYQFLTGDVILADGIARLTAVWGSPNNVGLYLGRLLPIALAFALMLRTNGRWVYVAIVALFAVTIFLTYSRGALFLGVPASVLFVLLMLSLRAYPVSRRTWIGIGAIALLGSIALVPFLMTGRGQNLFQTETGTGFFRLAVWTSAVQMIRDHPLLGVGLDNFLYEYPKYILPEAWREPNLSHPHNLLLDVWVRLGVFGIAVFVWMLVAFFQRARNSFTMNRAPYTRALMLGLMASMVDFLAHGLIDAAYFVVDLAYVFMLTLALTQTTNDE